jgi:phage N-6-adenine-methyltransferase
MDKGQNHCTLTSKDVVYGTPLWLFKELDTEFHFNTDVCSIPVLALCAHYYTPEVDGLLQDWKGVCWMNPPYGKMIGHWCKKAWEESRRGATVVGLLPARVDSIWFHEFVWHQAEIRFLKGRLTFRGAESRMKRPRWAAPFPCLIAVWRPPSASAQNAEFRNGGTGGVDCK